MARILGLKSASVISRWESGSRRPNIENLIRLAVLYRTMVDTFFLDLRRTFQREIRQRELGRHDDNEPICTM